VGGFGAGAGSKGTSGSTGTIGPGGGGGGFGGAIFNQGGTVLISNSTLQHNSALGGGANGAAGGSGFGGAVFNLNGDLELSSDTFADNSLGLNPSLTPGEVNGAAVYNLSRDVGSVTRDQLAVVAVANCIFDDPNPPGVSEVRNNGSSARIDAVGPSIALTAVANASGSVVGPPFVIADALLGALADNGGPTKTRAPQLGSPAIDAGANAPTVTTRLITDQRGFSRVSHGTVDLGAVEDQFDTLDVGGSSNASASVLTPNTATGQINAAPAATLSPFGSTGTDVRVAVADVNGDGSQDSILVTGPGTPIRLAVISGVDNSTLLVTPFDPFGGGFTGGGFVAAADIDHDGRAEFIVTPDKGGGPRISIFSLNTDGSLATRANFFGIDDPNFRGGCRAALGDANHDSTPDLVVCAGFLGGPRAALFDGTTLSGGNPTRIVNDFFAFPGADATTLRNGVFVAVGDINGDGFADLIFGGGPGGAPRVFVLSGALVSANDVAGAQSSPVANFFVAGNSSDRGGVRVAAVDADGDTKIDLVVGSGEGDPAKVRVYLGRTFASTAEPSTVQDLAVFGGAVLPGGVFVG
jgi:hypothetical protein